MVVARLTAALRVASARVSRGQLASERRYFLALGALPHAIVIVCVAGRRVYPEVWFAHRG